MIERSNDARHKRWRKAVLHHARSRGTFNCPSCGVLLNYDRSREPNSAEADHIIALKNGGRYTLENGQVLCRRCNQSKGARPAPLRRSLRKPRAVVHEDAQIYDW